jgi:hypothetical protein
MLATDRTTINDLYDISRDQDTHKTDYTGKARDFRFDENAAIVPSLKGSVFGDNVRATSLAPTDWAWSQIFTKLGPSVFGKGKDKSLPADNLLALRPEQRAQLLNDHLDHTETNWLVRGLDNYARAVLSDIYAPISNTDLLDVVRTVVKGSDVPVTITRSSAVTADSLNVRAIFKDIDLGGNHGNDRWGIGVYVRNGETGNRRGGILPLIQRHSCENSIVIDGSQSGFEFLHLGSAVAKLVQVKAAIANILPFAAHTLEQLIEADNEKIPEFSDVIAGICKQHGWPDDTAIKIAEGCEGRDTKLGLINGITYAAKFAADPDARADFEIEGGAILAAPDSLFYRAAELAKVERVRIERKASR